jgi:hypothetical protein
MARDREALRTFKAHHLLETTAAVRALRSEGRIPPRRGDCLTYGPGHYETWAYWRRDRTVEPALRAFVRSYEYEDWPRGRIVFDRARDLFIIYADRKLLTPAMIARIETQFHLPAGRTETQKRLALSEQRDAERLRSSTIVAVTKRAWTRSRR